jgi:multidrug resistance efflux pump
MRSKLSPLRWFASFAILFVAAAAVYFISHRLSPEAAEAGRPGAADPDEAKRQVVCLGRVDLAEGVASLSTAQPSRVTALLVKENAHVDAGTLLLRTDDRASCGAVEDAKGAFRAATDQLENARRMGKGREIQLRQQDANIRAARARLEAAKRGLEWKQSLQSAREAKLRAARARLEAAKRGLELKQSLRSLNQVNEKEVAVAEEQVKECEAGLEAELASLTDEKGEAIAREEVRQCEAALEVELARRAELELVDPQQQVRQAQANVERAQAALAQAEAAVEGQQVRAPAAGTVLRILTRPGEVVSPGSPAVLFAPDGPRIVRSEVEQSEVDRVAVGAAVVIQDDAVHGRSWRGSVLELADWYSDRRGIMEETSTFIDVPTVECLISIEGSGPPPRVGQRVRVHIETAKQQRGGTAAKGE